MLKKIIIFFFLLLVLTSFIVRAQQSAPIPEKTIIGMDVRDYRVYRTHHPPLDRLYCSGDTCFFLVEKNVLAKVESLRIPFSKHDMPGGAGRPLGGDNGDYHSYLETESMLFDLEARFPNLARLTSIGQSIEGRELYVLKISDNVTSNEEEPNVSIMGCHHAREWISVEVPLLFAQYLLEHYPGNSQVKRAVQGLQIYIMPIVNPDGLEFSIRTYRMWRKNRRYNGDFTWGIDLNRNYGYKWGYDDEGSSGDTYSELFRGPVPFSEPETTAVKAFLLEHPPVGSISYHNYSQLILYPWGYADIPTDDDAEMGAIAAEMSNLIFQVNGRTYTYGPGATTIYPTNGDSDDWIYATFGAFAYCIELPPTSFFHGGFITAQEEIDLSFSENLPALLYFVNYFVEDGSTPPGEKTGPKKSAPKPGLSKK